MSEPKEHKPMTEQRNCYNCEHCLYAGGGDYICDMNNDIVIADWTPTEDFYSCDGKGFEEI